MIAVTDSSVEARKFVTSNFLTDFEHGFYIVSKNK
jgi:hypothetical protein